MILATMCGSADPRSTNAVLLADAVASAPPGTQVRAVAALTRLPGFDPTVDGGPAVAALRAAVDGADALLIASPEYAHSMPGIVKNALDWLVGSGELSAMPVGLITASPLRTGGINAQVALVRTLLAQGGEPVVQLVVPDAKGKVADGAVQHEPTHRRLGEAVRALLEIAAERSD